VAAGELIERGASSGRADIGGWWKAGTCGTVAERRAKNRCDEYEVEGGKDKMKIKTLTCGPLVAYFQISCYTVLFCRICYVLHRFYICDLAYLVELL
jgi:hypothetical protein